MPIGHQAKRALVSFAIEQSLLEVGGAVMLDKVNIMLYKEYNSSIPDCYDPPDYLNKVLKKILGNSHKDIVESIKKQLEEFVYHEDISKFIQKIVE